VNALLISQSATPANRAREILSRQGVDCPLDRVLPPEFALECVIRDRPGLIVLVLSPAPRQALELLTQLRRHSAAPVIAIGPTSDPILLLDVLRAGVNDYVDEARLEQDLPAALARVAGGSEGAREPARVVAVVAASGGCGASTVALNVAVSLAAKRYEPLLIDLGLPTGDLATLLDLKPNHTIADLCQHVGRLDRSMLERSLLRHESGVKLLASPLNFADRELVTPDGVRDVLTLGRRLFSHHVVDLGHSFLPEQLEVLLQADTVLLVMRLQFASLRNAGRILDYQEQLGISRDKVRLVANHHGEAKQISSAQAEQALGVKIAHLIPTDPASVNRSGDDGVPVVTGLPRSRVSRSLTDLAASFNGKHP
jgi:pilus assembly protein CpaE